MAIPSNKVNITVECGADFAMSIIIRDDEGALVDLTRATVSAQLREYAEAQDYLQFTSVHNGAGGKITISMPHEDTAQIGYTSGVYDVYVTFPNEYVSKVIYGDVEVLPNVTKPVAGTVMYLLSFGEEDDFPETGLLGRLYFSHATSKMYRWNGTTYVAIVRDGEAATVEVGTTETLTPGSDATVENVGSLYNAVLDFGIPAGNGIAEFAKSTSGLTDTYTISFTDPDMEDYSFDVTNGRGIVSVAKTSSGLQDTYTFTYNDGTTSTIVVTNGNGVTNVTKTTEGLEDTYTFTFADSSTFDVVVTNGKGVSSVSKSSSGLTDTYTVTWNDSTTTTYTVTNGKGIVSITKTSSEDLVDEYTITFNDGDTLTYEVTNGMDCTHEWDGTVLTITSASGTSSADLQGTTDYEELTNVPETFPPSSHNHDDRYYTESEMDTALALKATVSSVTTLAGDVADGLALKADADDVYDKSTVDNKLLEKEDKDQLGDLAYEDSIDYEGSFLTNKPELGALADHDTIDYDTEIDNLPELGTLAAENDVTYDDNYYMRKNGNWFNADSRYYTETEIDTALAGKSDTSHTHDDRYYTETEIDTALALKADASSVYTKSESDALFNDKAPVILASASGSIASFSDGSPAPVSALSVSVEPVQDLHGYDNPWPAGGGKNILPNTYTNLSANGLTFTVNDDGTVKVTGTATADTDMNLIVGTSLVALMESGETYYFSGCPSGGSQSTYMMRLNIIGKYDTGSGITQTYSGSSFGNFSIRIANGYAISGSLLFKPQIVKSSTAVAWSPYANLCPISGHTAVNVTRTNTNIWGGEKMADDLVNAVNTSQLCYKGSDSDGDFVHLIVGSAMSNKIVFTGFKPDTRYTIMAKVKKSNTNGNTNIGVMYSDGTNGYVQILGTVVADTIYNIVTSTIAGKSVDYIYLVWGSGSTKFYYDDFGVFEGVLTASDFVPYQGITLSIPLGSTVYGATVDVLTGVLTVTDAIQDLGELTYSKSTSGLFQADGLGTVIKRTVNTGYPSGNIISSMYLEVGSNGITGPDGANPSPNGVMALNGQGRLYFNNTAYTDKDLFKTAMSGVQLMYKLATPTTIQLTPSQLSTLLGQNAIWADTGDILDVTYRADSKLYIDGQIADANRKTREMMTTVTTEMKAPKNLTSGDLVIVNDDLYKATSNIASGATLTVGTNVSKLTLAEYIQSLLV